MRPFHVDFRSGGAGCPPNSSRRWAAGRGRLVRCRQVVAARCNLPLLSHALRASWLASDRHTLTFADYHQAGAIDGAIVNTAENSYAKLPPDAQDAARRALLRMVRVPANGEATRRRVHRDDLPHSPTTTIAIESLSRARLISIDGDNLEVIHDSLLTEWPRLRGWIVDNRTWLHTRDQLTDDATT